MNFFVPGASITYTIKVTLPSTLVIVLSQFQNVETCRRLIAVDVYKRNGAFILVYVNGIGTVTVLFTHLTSSNCNLVVIYLLPY